MNNKKIINIAFLFGIFAFAGCQKTETNVAKDSNLITDTVKQDSASILEDKKVTAKSELAALPKIYNPEEDANLKLAEVIKQAQSENKNIMIQAGGNWCIWCLRFDKYVQTTPELKSIVDQNYIYYHLNYSPENKNEKLFTKFGDPGKMYGYPVFIVLDKDGKKIHTQDSAVLEEGKGYSLEKVKKFFTDYAPKS